MSRKLTIEEFEAQCAKIHGGKYIYHQDYTLSTSKIRITCPIHGDFYQTAATHKSGAACPKCGKQHLADIFREKDFINKALIIHKNKYDYDKVIYRNMFTPVIICCPEHGEFMQKPMKHLRGNGCPTCGKEKSHETRKQKSADSFEQRAIEVHGSKYDYSRVEYVDCYTPVEIICHIHGSFWQRPIDHTQGCGCPRCAWGEGKTVFFASDKLSLLTQSDLLSMDSFCLLDLISEDRLPKEFAELAKFGENTEGRKKLIQKLTDQYGSLNDENEEQEAVNEDGIANPAEEKISTDGSIDELLQEIIPQQRQHQGVLGEIHSIASIIQHGDTKTYSSGNKMEHIATKEISKLWSQVLRDDENHNMNTINEINDKLK